MEGETGGGQHPKSTTVVVMRWPLTGLLLRSSLCAVGELAQRENETASGVVEEG